jgi:pimeloyl-ACP methyl ester carboxylesterase
METERVVYLTIGGTSLEGRWYGHRSENGPIIVMLHEGLGSITTWGDFPERLAKATGTAVFAYSRAGHGFSSKPEVPRPMDTLHREANDILPQVLDLIGFRRGVLVGHSDGGSIVTIYAGGSHDQGVQGIVLIEPHFNVETVNLRSIRRLGEAFSSTDLRARLSRHHSDVQNTFNAWYGMWLDPRFESFDITPVLELIRVPILFVKCEHDPYSTMLQVELAQTMCKCPLETLLIASADHSPHRSNPTTTLDGIVRFVAPILSGDGPPSDVEATPRGHLC